MQLIKSTRYADTSIDKKYTDLEKELMLFAEVQGKQNGIDNKPLTEREFKALFLNMVETKIQSTIDENQQENLPVSGVVVAQAKQKEANEIVNPLASSLNDKALEHRTLEEQKKSCTPDMRKRRIRKVVYFALAVISVTEGFFAYGALRRLPMAIIPALVNSVGVAAAIGIATHTLAGYISKAKTRLQFLIRFFISTAPIFIGFYALGYLRAKGLNTATQMNLNVHQSTVVDSGVSAIAITILSFLLFLAALIVVIKYHKTEEEIKEEKEFDKACRQLNECEKQMQEIKTAIERTKGEASIQSANALCRYEYALAVENRLKALGKQVVQEYIIKNLCYRTDTITPVFFSEPPALNLRLFFDNLKKD
ncbi:hypothetical protein [Ferruginibacter sp.]|nr:hypothetical protein [Ferruginibacter sp.]